MTISELKKLCENVNKYNMKSFIKMIDVPLENGQTGIEYIIKNKYKFIRRIGFFRTFITDERYTDQIVENYEEYIYHGSNENTLLVKRSDNLFLIEYLIKKNKRHEKCIKLIRNNIIAIDLCIKYNISFDNLSETLLKKLFDKENIYYLKEKYKNNNELAKYALSKIVCASNVYNYALYKNDLTLIKYAKDTVMLEKLCNIVDEFGKKVFQPNDNRTLFEYILNEGLVDENAIKNINNSNEIAKILYERKRFDLLKYMKLSLLINYPNRENSYLDILIKEGENLDNLLEENSCFENKAILYLKLIDVVEDKELFINRISSQEEAYEDILKWMSLIDEEKTLKYFIKSESFSKNTSHELVTIYDFLKEDANGKIIFEQRYESEETDFFDIVISNVENNYDYIRKLYKKVDQEVFWDFINYYLINDNKILFIELDNNENVLELGIKTKKIFLYNTKEIFLEKRDGGCLAINYIEKDNFIKCLSLSDKDMDNIISQLPESKKNIIPNLIAENLWDVSDDPLEWILDSPTPDNNYLQMLIKTQSNDFFINFVEEIKKTSNLEAKARFYIQMGKNYKTYFLNQMEEDELFAKNDEEVTLIEMLCELDKWTVEHQLINSHPIIVNNIENYILAKKFNLYNIRYGIKDIAHEIFNNDYTDVFNQQVEELLSEVENLFLNDGKSDPNSISALIISYRYACSIDAENIKELKQLIEAKKHDSGEFVYKTNAKILSDDETEAFFSNINGVQLTYYNLPTINHETGHALHYYLANYSSPENLNNVIEERKKEQDYIAKKQEFIATWNEYEKKVKVKGSDFITKILEDQEYLANLSKSTQKFISKKIDSKCLKNYTIEELKLLFNEEFNYEDFVKQSIKDRKDEIESIYLRYEMDYMWAISDIIDAIELGKIHDEKNLPGHGKEYYSNNSKIFREIIANYSAILKSKNRDRGLKMLKDIVGEELFNLIDTYYRDNIINSKKYVDLDGEKKKGQHK